ncbi:ferritin-like domain-containing protein [Nocardioides daejeonensis]|uniref:ferritin-like domain-containing protein n=1 Tax=Nocardioides daejeonensis TaxID=1046556 RepID=UPI000D74E45A|nr:ferritin-like domain-containing protein [Nocardioides daejeonensis]
MSTVDDLNTVLAGEHAAVYLFATLGGRTSASAEPTLAAGLRSAHSIHRARRDQLVRMVLDLDGSPEAVAVGYELPNASRTPTQIRRGALQVESRCTALYSDLVARTQGADRSWAMRALVDSAVRQLGFGGLPSDLPGT